jgi:2-keto-3-deoxy-L-rhamnonate aldolase RhmA
MADGETVFGTFVSSLYSPAPLKIMAAAGLDFVILDLEHTGFGWSDLGAAIAYCRAIALAPLVRVPTPSRDSVGRALDLGAVGLVFPRVEDADYVRRVAELTLYPPDGNRAVALGLGNNDFVPPAPVDYIASANKELVNVLQIETVKGMQNLDAICRTAAETGCATVLEVSRADLTTSMGIPMDFGDPRYLEAVRTVLAAGGRHGLVPGKGFADMKDAEKWMKLGFRFCIYASELGVFRQGWQAAMRELRHLGGQA